MDDGAIVRRFQGRPAVFHGVRGDEEVEAVVGGRVLILHRADWRSLPPYEATEPPGGRKAE